MHERFTAEEMQNYRADHPGVKILAHPECPREVIEVSDFAGSTAAMIDYVRNKKPARVLLVTECRWQIMSPPSCRRSSSSGLQLLPA